MQTSDKNITFTCPQCNALQTVGFKDSPGNLGFNCGACQKPIRLNHLIGEHIENCPVCSDHKFHQHKDFNKTLGLLIFIVGAVLVPYTYAVSLMVALVLDALLYPFCPWMLVCYNCQAEFRGWPKNPNFDRFNHETAAHYEYGKKKNGGA